MKKRVKSLHQSKKKWVIVNDRMQKGYWYELAHPVGRDFDPEFKPELTPTEMLALGVLVLSRVKSLLRANLAPTPKPEALP